MQVLRLLLRVMRNLRTKRDCLGCHTTPDTLLSEKSLSTASASGLFGLGVVIVCVDMLPAVHTRPSERVIGSKVGRGFQRSAWIIAFCARPIASRARRRMRAILFILFDSKTGAIYALAVAEKAFKPWVVEYVLKVLNEL